MSSPHVTMMNELQHGVQGGLKYILGAAMLMASAFAFAATPLNDQELDTNFVSGGVPNDPSGKVFKQIVSLADVKPSPLAIIPIDDLTALFGVLDNQQSQITVNATDPFKGTTSFGEMAASNFGSEFYSFRWAENFDRMYNPSNFQYYYFNTASGYMEVDNNIHGRVDVEAVTYSGDRRETLYRSSYVFN